MGPKEKRVRLKSPNKGKRPKGTKVLTEVDQKEAQHKADKESEERVKKSREADDKAVRDAKRRDEEEYSKRFTDF